VINLRQVEYILYDTEQTLKPAMDIAYQIVEHQAAIGRALGAEVNVSILKGASAEREIINFARAQQVDLIVLGSNIRMITGRVFYGHRVDAILNRANCPVAVISSI
jgi:nucleotide-binding universal stress UspA family protein